MSSKTCQNCGAENPPNMSFCTNCGNSLASAPQSSGNVPQSNASDIPPPPTVFSYQPNLQANPATPPITPSTQPPAAKKGNKGLIFGLVGCGGLLLLSLIGLVVAAVFFGSFDSNSNTSNTRNEKVKNSNTAKNTNKSNDNSSKSNSSDDSGKSDSSSSSSSSSAMLGELQKLKQIGDFKQTDLKAVTAKEFFPSSTDVAQASYTNGSKIVISTLGKFPSDQAAFDDFDAQIKSVKAQGGTIYSNEAKNGTKAALYKYKGHYFIEACGDATCSRNNSEDLDALRSFATSFGDAVNNSSN